MTAFRNTTRAALLLLPLAFTSAGCLVGGHSNVKREGVYVAPATLDQIKPGKTTMGWVEAVVGTPSSRIDLEPGHEIWKYAYKETKDSRGYVFLIFNTSDKKVTDGNVFVEFENGIVSRTWRG